MHSVLAEQIVLEKCQNGIFTLEDSLRRMLEALQSEDAFIL